MERTVKVFMNMHVYIGHLPEITSSSQLQNDMLRAQGMVTNLVNVTLAKSAPFISTILSSALRRPSW